MPVQFLTLIHAWRATNVGIDSLELEGVVWLWLSRKRPISDLRVNVNLLFTIGDSIATFWNASHLSLVTSGDHRLNSYLFAVQSCFWKFMCLRYDHFDHSVVRASGQVLTWVGDLYVADRAESCSFVRGNNWLSICNAWRCILRWNELVVSDEEERAISPKLGVSQCKLVDFFAVVCGELSLQPCCCGVESGTTPVSRSWV